MFKIAWFQYKENWKTSIGTFLILLLSATLIGTFSLLFINALIYGHSNLGTEESRQTIISIVASLFGLVIVLAILILFNTLNLSVRLKWEQYLKLRILGFSFRQIKIVVYLENFLLSLVALLISLGVAIPVGNLITDYLVNQNVVDRSFKITDKISYQWIYVLSTIALVWFILFLAVAPNKRVELSKVNNPFHQNFVWSIISFCLGILALGGVIALTLIPAVQNPNIVSPIALANTALFITFFGFAGKPILRVVFLLFSQINPHAIYWNSALKESQKSLNQNFQVILMMVILSLAISYAFNINSLGLEEAPGEHWVEANQVLLLLLTAIFGLYAFVICLNSLVIYFLNKEKEFNDLRILGQTRAKILRQITYQALIIAFSALIFGMIPAFVTVGIAAKTLGYQEIKITTNLGVTLGQTFGLIGGTLLFSLIPSSIQMLTKNIH